MNKILLALLASLVVSSTHASSIRVRQECGFSFAVCGEEITLEQNGTAYTYLVPGPTAPLSYSLAYLDDDFVMTALGDNRLGGSLPFGLAVYPGSGPLLTLAFPNSTAYGFIAMNSFPRAEGATRTLAIPPAPAEVPEPPAALLVLSGLAALGCHRRRTVA